MSRNECGHNRMISVLEERFELTCGGEGEAEVSVCPDCGMVYVRSENFLSRHETTFYLDTQEQLDAVAMGLKRGGIAHE